MPNSLTLLEIRQKFVPLVTDRSLATGDSMETDAGADYYINAGVDLLDELASGLRRPYSSSGLSATYGLTWNRSVSTQLTENTDTNWWTENKSGLVLMAARACWLRDNQGNMSEYLAARRTLETEMDRVYVEEAEMEFEDIGLDKDGSFVMRG